MATATIEKYLPQTAAYINWVFENDSKKRGGHHNYVIEQRICNSQTAYVEMSEDDLKYEDFESFESLYKLDNKPNIFKILSAEYDEEIGSEVTASILDEEYEFVVQLSGGDFQRQMGCQISHESEGDYAPADTDILSIFISEVISAAEKAYTKWEEIERDQENWQKVEDGDIEKQTATSFSRYIIEQKINFDENIDDFEYRVVTDNTGFVQPNDYSSLLDFSVEGFTNLELAKKWLAMDADERRYN